jgi:hypothetical protein
MFCFDGILTIRNGRTLLRNELNFPKPHPLTKFPGFEIPLVFEALKHTGCTQIL